jgi:hypothetical protein
MADLIEIGVEVRTNSVRSATKEVDSLGKTLKSAERSASAFVNAFASQERQVSKAATANRAYSSTAQAMYNEILKVNTATKSASGSASVFAAGLEKQAQALHRLKMSTDASYASTNKLQAAKKILKREVRENGMAVEQYVEAMRKVVQANNAAGASAGVASKHMSRGGVAMQQVGYQVGDFIVQVQSGQNPMVAFGQQATQMVGALYMLPPAALAGRVALMGLSVSVGLLIASLGIVIPLATAIGAALMRTREAADKGTSGLNSYEEALGRVIEKAKGLKNERLSLTTNFDADAMIASEKRVKLSNRIVELEIMQAGLSEEKLEGNKRLVQTLKNQLSEETKLLSAALKSAEAEGARVATLKDAADAKEAEAKAVKDLAKSQAESQAAFQEQLAAQANSLVLLEMEKEGLKGSTQYREELVAQEADRLQKLISQKKITETQAEDALNLYEENLKVTSEIDASTKSAIALSGALREAASAMASLSSFGAGLDKAIAVAAAKVGALKVGANEAVAGRIAGLRADLEIKLLDKSLRSEAVADIRAENQGKISTLENLLDQGSEIRSRNRKAASQAAKGLSEAAKAAKDLSEEALKLNEANDPLLKFNKGIDNLNKLMKTGKLTQKAYNGEVAKLQDGLAGSIPLVGDISDAFGDFVARGLKDFKGFVQQILGSFTSMISQMIATAARNKIMLSMGIGGTGIAGKAAGLGGSLLGSAGGGLAGLAGSGGIMGGVGSIASGIGGIFSGGGLGASFANLGGLMSGSVGGLGAIGAAIPAIGLVVAGLGLFIKKTKVLDTGLRATVDGFDVAIETFEKTQTSRLFGLLKGKKKTGYAGASAEVADPLVKAVGEIQQSVLDAADTLGIGADAFDNFSYQFKVSLKGLSEEEQFQKVTQELNKMGDSFASLSGHFETMNELLAAANKRMELRNRMDKLLNNNAAILTRQREAELSAMHALNRPLAQAVYQLEDAQSVVTNAFAALRASIDSVVSDLKDKLGLANEAINKSKSIYETLSDALRSRRVSGDEAFSGRREAAVSFLRRGVFGDERKLQNALGVVAEPSEQLFGSFVDYARDFGLTGNVIAKAAETAKVQLSADEQAVELLETQIETFDAQLQMMVNQYNALLGIDTSVKSVADAMSALRSALGSFASAQGAAKATASAKVPQAKETAAALEEVTVVRTFKGGNDFLRNGASGVELSNGQVFKTEKGWGDSKEIQNATKKAREAVIAAGGIPKFAAGGMHSGGLRMVGERGPELEATGPSRIFSHNQTSGLFKDPDLKEAVNELRREVSGLRDEQRQMGAASAKYAKRNYDINRKWDTNGLPSTRT